MAETDDWSANANDALAITLCQPSKAGPKPYKTFHPRFTYPIFGDEEQIFGYKDLKISLRYRANDMRPFVKISYAKMFDAVGDTEPADVEGALKEFLPAVAFSSEADFVEGTKQLSPDWKPPGELHAESRDASGEYEIWRGSLADPVVKQTINRLDILAPLFIEGGTPIIGKDEAATQNLEDDRWTVFFLYRKEKSADDPTREAYIFVGYSTIYRFYYYEKPTAPPPAVGDFELPTKGDADMWPMPCRSRLSQFVILPPFQNAGNGARLYSTIFKHFHEHPQTRELTVEDPNEAFDDLRDVCDLAFLETLPEFRALKLNPSYAIPKKGPLPPGLSDKAAVESVRRRAKMAPRQFQRCVEMHMMLELPDSVRPHLPTDDAESAGTAKGKGRMAPPATREDRKAYELWQLFVKTRLYVHNRDALGELDARERAEKLQETLEGVELEYARLLAVYRRRAQAQSVGADKNGKRKLDAGEGEEETGGSSKRARVTDEEVEMRTTV